MRYAGLIKNDMVNGEGVCVSFWTQGCPHRCPGCHNPETWDFDGGMEVPTDIKGQIIKAISANGVERNFSVLGGEPLCPENIELTCSVITAVRAAYSDIKIYLWTGYTFNALPLCDELEKIIETHQHIGMELKELMLDPFSWGFPYLNPTSTLWSKCHAHFTDEVVEAGRQ